MRAASGCHEWLSLVPEIQAPELCCAIRMSVDVLSFILDCVVGGSPFTFLFGCKIDPLALEVTSRVLFPKDTPGLWLPQPKFRHAVPTA